jgi:DNA-binding response OmpR family regulator
MVRKSVAVMNSSKEITDILQEVLKSEGFLVNSTFTYVFKGKERNFDNFVKRYKPTVIVYDIAIPYDENYELFKALSRRASAEKISFVLTTTNKDALDKIVGRTKAHEILGKPYDLTKIVSAVSSLADSS